MAGIRTNGIDYVLVLVLVKRKHYEHQRKIRAIYFLIYFTTATVITPQ